MVHYIVIDGDGNKISKEYSSPGTISDCLPILTRNNQIVFYTSSSNSVDFYLFDIFTLLESGEFSHSESGKNDRFWFKENSHT